MERAGQLMPSDLLKSPRGRLGPARWQIQIRDLDHGDSLTLQLHASPWPNRWITSSGEFSSAHLGRAIALMLGSGS